MNKRPEPDSMPPQDGYGGGIPKPRNDRPDSARITVPSPMVARMMMVAITFGRRDRKSTRLNSSHGYISYAVFCLKKKKKKMRTYNLLPCNQECVHYILT